MRALLYARVSGDDRKYSTSGIESQLVDCRKYCADQGYTVVGEIVVTPEKHTSGAEWQPELDRVLLLARQGKFDILVVREIDRLARNRFMQMSVEAELDANGVKVAYVLGQFEDSDEGRLLKGLMGEFAEYERGKIKQRTTRGVLRSVSAGNVTIGGSYAPYGYDLVNLDHRARALVINRTEAASVQLIFDLYVNQGYTLHAIADYLDRHTIAKPAKGNNHKKRTNTERPKGWSVGTLNGILGNETYVGRWYYRKTKSVKVNGKQRTAPRPRSEWLMVEVPAIISEAVFKAAAARRAANKRRKEKSYRKFDYLLGGVIRCAHCNNSASGITKVQGEKHWSYYKCNAAHLPKRYGFKCENSVQFRAGSVDAAVWNWIKGILLDPETLHAALEEYQQTRLKTYEPILRMIDTNRAKVEALNAKKGRLIDAFTDGVFTLDEIAQKKVDLERQISDFTEAIEKLQAQLDPTMLTDMDIDTIHNYAAKVREGIELADNDFEAQRQIIDLLQVTVSLLYLGGERWVDVSCVLGNERLATNNITKSCNGSASRRNGSNRAGRRYTGIWQTAKQTCWRRPDSEPCRP
jgi:site-specific DNA recombinase